MVDGGEVLKVHKGYEISAQFAHNKTTKIPFKFLSISQKNERIRRFSISRPFIDHLNLQ